MHGEYGRNLGTPVAQQNCGRDLCEHTYFVFPRLPHRDSKGPTSECRLCPRDDSNMPHTSHGSSCCTQNQKWGQAVLNLSSSFKILCSVHLHFCGRNIGLCPLRMSVHMVTNALNNHTAHNNQRLVIHKIKLKSRSMVKH